MASERDASEQDVEPPLKKKIDRHTEVYWANFRIAEEVLLICQRNNIQIWPEYGTALGLARTKSGELPNFEEKATPTNSNRFEVPRLRKDLDVPLQQQK